MSSPYQGHDPATPPGAEAALQQFSDSLEEARQALASARDTEVDAEYAYRAALRKARLSDQAPKPGVTDGVRTTVAFVDAWVEDQCADEEFEWRVAKTARQAAADHLRTLRDQGSIQQSISKSVADSYRGTGGHKW